LTSGAAAVLVTAAMLEAASPTARPGPGAFLFATPDLGGSVFEATVVLLVAHDAQGSVGVIVNRPGRLSVAETLECEAPEEATVFFGGPVDVEGIVALLRTRSDPAVGHRALEDVFFTLDRGAIEGALGRPDAAERVRVYAGYSGWGPGQLDGEIARGFWVMARASADDVFREDVSTLWERVYRLLGATEARAAFAK
jgi:putative transcriptional regulator